MDAPRTFLIGGVGEHGVRDFLLHLFLELGNFGLCAQPVTPHLRVSCLHIKYANPKITCSGLFGFIADII